MRGGGGVNDGVKGTKLSATIRRGGDAIRELLATQSFDVREVDAARFPAWLEPHLAHWRRNPEFVQRARIRELRRAHPELRALEEERRRARAADESSPLFARLEAVRVELTGAEKAVAGLTHALKGADPGEAERLRLKRDAFLARAEALRAEERELTRGSEPRLELLRVAARLERLRAELGLDAEEARLRELQRRKGRSTSRSGREFEEAAEAAVREVVLPELVDDPHDPGIVVLRGVSLGAARTEIDRLVARVAPGAPARGGEVPVEVLALVEAKRNVNDVAHGLHRRLENLAWLAGHDPGYDPEPYRTRGFPSGHFEGVGMHARQGRRDRFTRASFRLFLPDLRAGALPDRLYLVTRPGPLWGLGSAGLARIAHRVSSDESWDPGDPEYLAALLAWCQGLAGPVEAPEVLARYAEAGAGERVVLVG